MKEKIQNEQPRYLTSAEDLDHPGDWWRVEYFDSDGTGYITIFASQQAEARAKDYHDAIAETAGGRPVTGVPCTLRIA